MQISDYRIRASTTASFVVKNKTKNDDVTEYGRVNTAECSTAFSSKKERDLHRNEIIEAISTTVYP